MKWTKVFVSILCFLCFLSTGEIAEGSGQPRVSIAVPRLLEDLPLNWRPTAGDSLSFRVKVTKPPHYSGGTLTATLSDVTSYRGQHGNKAATVPAIFYDLTLYIAQNYGWSAKTPGVLNSLSLTHPILKNVTSSEATEWMTLRVDCEDYAAYGKLTFTASGSTGNALPYVIKIPRDVNGNKIADGWRNDETTADPNNNNPSKNYVASWDEESGPAAPNTQRGDTVTVLDEYRGLDINGTWTETDPEGWDVFISSESGLGYAGSLPGMTPHLMGSNQVDYIEGHVMPYQASNSVPSGKVYAIRLKNNPDPFDRNNPLAPWGEMGTGPPYSGTRGDVWTERIGVGITVILHSQTKSGMIAYVTAHEIGHGVHLLHCPDHTGLDCYMWAQIDSSSDHVTQYHSHHLVDYDLKNPIIDPQAPLAIPQDKIRVYDPKTGTWSLKNKNSGKALLTPSGVSYAGTAGGTHTASLSAPSGWTSIYWYLKSPSESGLGTSQSTDTDSTGMYTTASYTYMFPSGVSGDYVLMAYTTLSDNTVVQPSYTVSVSLPDSSTPPTTPSPPSTPATPPGVPTYFNLSQNAAVGSIGLYWSAPASDGGASIVDYEYQYRYETGYSGGSYIWTDWSSWSSAGTDGFYAITGLYSYLIHEVKMRAVNSAGPGTETQTQSISTQ